MNLDKQKVISLLFFHVFFHFFIIRKWLCMMHLLTFKSLHNHSIMYTHALCFSRLAVTNPTSFLSLHNEWNCVSVHAQHKHSVQWLVLRWAETVGPDIFWMLWTVSHSNHTVCHRHHMAKYWQVKSNYAAARWIIFREHQRAVFTWKGKAEA